MLLEINILLNLDIEIITNNSMSLSIRIVNESEKPLNVDEYKLRSHFYKKGMEIYDSNMVLLCSNIKSKSFSMYDDKPISIENDMFLKIDIGLTNGELHIGSNRYFVQSGVYYIICNLFGFNSERKEFIIEDDSFVG
jgi:hypothetical protein